MTEFVGVDISKAKFDAAVLREGGKFRSKAFANDAAGFAALLQWLGEQAPGALAHVHVCMEATGSYHEALACFLHEHGVCISVVNPMLVKRFAELRRVRNKTDSADAKCLAMFCQAERPQRWQAPSLALRTLQALVARLDTLQALRQGEANRLEVAHPSVADSIRSVMAELDAAITQVKAQIRRTVDDDPDLRSRAKLLHTIPGLGERSIAQLLAYIGEPTRFTSGKALVAYASLTPRVRQSGSSLNQSRGTYPMGHRDLRKTLYFPAMVAGRFNPPVAAFWKHLRAQNKPGKVIVLACMHKLLRIVWAVLRTGKPFNASHHDLTTA